MTIPAPAHTPGPWFVVPYGDGDSLVICRDEAGERRVAFMATPGCRDSVQRKKVWREIRANARLIAAAPALLEALQYWMGQADSLPYFTVDDAVFREKSRAAIAQAIGEA